MSRWTQQELLQANKEDLYISAPNEDGKMHAPTWVWMVEVDGNLYCRSYNGPKGSWYTASKRAGHGRAKFGNIDLAVTFDFLEDETLNKKSTKPTGRNTQAARTSKVHCLSQCVARQSS